MNRLIPLVLFIAFVAPFPAHGQETIIKKDELLTLDRCVEIALMKHPTIVAARNNVLAGQSRVFEARSAYYPQIAANAGYSRTKSLASLLRTSTTGTGGTLLSGGSGSSFDQYSGSITLSQNIYDFGKTGSQVDIQKLGLDASRSDLDTTVDQVLFGVKQAYYGALQAKRKRDVAEETVKQFQQHLEQAKGFYEVGTKPKFDVTKAEVDLSNSRLNLIKAENSVKVAKVTLNNALGAPDAPEYLIEDNLAFQKYEMSFQQAIETAYKNRPDLQSLLWKRMAAERSIDLARTGFYPALTGTAAYNRGGRSGFQDEGWNVGVGLTFPIFSGFLTRNQVEEAKANLAAARANEETLKQSIYLDVQQAYLNLGLAEDSINNTQLTVQQATENFEIANGRYAAGVGNPIEVTDAEVSLANAKTGHIQALYDYKVARASIERAMGLR
ncbi:MAG: TolC family protein [Nitrospiraceae bacterium]|nr:TolC family protein [Nitrospiraceae bacterium]